ncbi:hypothetical protein DYB25_013064 [Aphanomyces astaci]|uniref:Uncharacterized protein n=1 Tax=Aphanomyces astaci TaxID=112090 RepID=A0A397B8U5_APHAT|nr:hypothetical protein DYB25_013064 [Aphanomyces astaci]
MEDDPKVSVEGLRGIEVQMRQLLQEEEYDSVVLLGSIFCSPTPMSPDKQLEHAVHDLNLVFADALVHKREYKRALLDRIPPSRRTLGMNMLCGNLHLTQGSTRYTPCKSSSCLNSLTIHRQAEVAFLAALTANPYAVEATLALAEIAGKNEERKPNPLDDSDIVHMYTELGETGGIDATDAAWLQSLVDAHIQLHSHQFQYALESLDDMERVVATTHSLHCHLYRASVLMELECPEQAMASFARHCDAHNVLYMDVFAFLLKQAGLTMQLNRSDRPEYAVKSFSHASKLAKTMDAYEGMSEGLCSLCLKGADKYTDAINIARLALMYMPHSPRAYLLLGSVLSLRPESRDKVQNALRGVDRVEKLLRGDGDASQYDDVMDDRRQSSGSA